MSRFAPYLGGLFALFVGVVALILSNKFAPIPRERVATPTATSSAIIVLPATPEQPAPPVSVPPVTSIPKTVVPEKIPSSPEKVVKTTPKDTALTATTVVPEVQPVTVAGNTSIDTAAKTLRSALVNIICYAPAGGKLHSISGSGIFIDTKGIILTNAHIAQYFLLKNRGVDCSIRSGSPATSLYEAEPIFISPAWIAANTTVLTQTLPSGTGENDYALLGITKSSTSVPLPSSFSSIPLATQPPASGAPIVIASYGAQFLESSQIQSSLFPTLVFGSIKDIFTFRTNTVDVLALGGSAAAQEGSSGGGVADASGLLIGTITTSTVQGDTSTRSLDAITASYIRAAYARESGMSLDELMSQSIKASVTIFSSQIPTLEALITPQLQ